MPSQSVSPVRMLARAPATTGCRPGPEGHWALGVSLLLILLSVGCRTVQTAVDVPGQAFRAVSPGKHDKSAVDPVEVQQALLRFADAFSTRMVNGIDQLRRGAEALDRAEALRWKIAIRSETCSLASGQNPIANMLDMTLLVTVSRRTLEEHWQPRIFGESARPLLEGCRQAEEQIWHLAEKVLKPEQQAELRQAIETRLQQNSAPENVLVAPSLGFAPRVAAISQTEADNPGGVFSLLKVDPFAGMDPAVREIAETRMFAERALFVSQQMPELLRWQTELLSLEVVEMPTVQQLVTNSTQIASSVERFSAVAEKLPVQLSTERAEILKALQSQEKEVASLTTSGTRMSDSLNTTITSFDALMKRFGVGETNVAASPASNAEPFRIQDYAATAAQLETTARQLTALLITFDQTLGSTNLMGLSAQVVPVLQHAQAGGKEIVDYAFRKVVLLTVIALGAFLIYAFFAARWAPAAISKLQTKS